MDRYELLGLLTEGDSRYLEYSTEISADGKNVLWLSWSENIKFGPFETSGTQGKQTIKVPHGFLDELKKFMSVIKKGSQEEK